ncbi:MAG TPA: hypothetical protein VFS00_17525 [Polyangiaceae bacterium]|nr:hypothetical protein [Polyangiaceae bacterium]
MGDTPDELVLFAQDDLHLWHEPKPGYSIFGSYVGRAVLTSRRFLFLSTGTSGAARRALAVAALGPLGAAAFGKTPTSELNLSALEQEGSLELPLGRVRDHGAHRRWDLATYVNLAYASAAGEAAACSFMPKNSLLWRGARVWGEHLAGARAPFAAGPYRSA